LACACVSTAISALIAMLGRVAASSETAVRKSRVTEGGGGEEGFFWACRRVAMVREIIREGGGGGGEDVSY